MCVRVAGGFTPIFQAEMGVKQGCPLSPTLFGMFLDDFEGDLLRHAEAAALPRWQSGRPLPPLFYADDQALLSSTADGLRYQLRYLQRYCRTWGLTVNTKKTKIVVYTPHRAAAPESFSYGADEVEAVPTFKYLGMHLHCTHAFASAAGYRAEAGRRAMHVLRRRLAENGLHSPTLSLSMFRTFVLPVLSYAAEVWAPQLVLQGGSACEKVHFEFLRGLLGVRDSTPKLVLLAETGQLPLAVHWTKQIARFVNRLHQMGDDRIAKQAFLDNLDLAGRSRGGPLASQPWAAQAAQVLEAAGGPLDLLTCDRIDVDELQGFMLRKHVALLNSTDASAKVQCYTAEVRGGPIDSDTYTLPQPYLTIVPRRCQFSRLAQIRTGSDWLAVETGRWQRLAREQHVCPHCHTGAVEDAPHVTFCCPHYAEVREQFAYLFQTAPGTTQNLAAFLGQQDQKQVAKFYHLCHAAHSSVAQPACP